jgi:hypothetical protein
MDAEKYPGSVPPVISRRSHSRAVPVGVLVLAAVFVIGSVLGAAVLYRFDPTRSDFYPICTFHQVTELHCPGCGTLRAAHQLLHGNLLAALQKNALFVLLLPVIGLLLANFILERTRGRGLRVRPLPAAWLWALVALILAFSLLRNLPLVPFNSLAP